MREFSRNVSDRRLAELLAEALDGDKPAKLFTAILRDVPDELHRWHATMTSRVRQRIHRWQRDHDAAHNVEIDRPEEPSQETEGSRPLPYDDSQPDFIGTASQLVEVARRGGTTTPGRWQRLTSSGDRVRPGGVSSGKNDALRAALHSA
jgi:Uncharacterised protein family (UPF0158)